MSTSLRSYHYPQDFQYVSDFLVDQFQPANRDGNWLQPTWEYMHSHPWLDASVLNRIALWEEAGQLVGVAHYEMKLGDAFFEIRQGYDSLKPQMLDYAEAQLTGQDDSGRRYLRAYANDTDPAFEACLKSRGYQLDPAAARPLSHLALPACPPPALPAGFCLKSLADENDLYKINRVLWRGFDHPGEPPFEEQDRLDRLKMQSGPHFRKDLALVVTAPDGNFVSFSGAWHEPQNHYALLEPVATDPSFRRMGLGKAAVLEGLQRCAAEGARDAFVGSDQDFYKALGFKTIITSQCWLKYFG